MKWYKAMFLLLLQVALPGLAAAGERHDRLDGLVVARSVPVSWRAAGGHATRHGHHHHGRHVIDRHTPRLLVTVILPAARVSVPLAWPAPPVVRPRPASYWYFCANPVGYYPDVGRCAVEWQLVAAAPR